MTEIEKYQNKLKSKTLKIKQLKKQIEDLINPDMAESFYKTEYYKLIDDIDEFKQIEKDLIQENEELKQEIFELLLIISGVSEWALNIWLKFGK